MTVLARPVKRRRFYAITIFCVLISLFLIWELVRAFTPLSWPKLSGTITEVMIQSSPLATSSTGPIYGLKAQVRYTQNGLYKETTVIPRILSTSTVVLNDKASQLKNTNVRLTYDPAYPNNVYPVETFPIPWLLLLTILFLLVLSGVLLKNIMEGLQLNEAGHVIPPHANKSPLFIGGFILLALMGIILENQLVGFGWPTLQGQILTVANQVVYSYSYKQNSYIGMDYPALNSVTSITDGENLTSLAGTPNPDKFISIKINPQLPEQSFIPKNISWVIYVMLGLTIIFLIDSIRRIFKKEESGFTKDRECST